MSVLCDLIFLVFVLGGAVFGSQVPVFVDAYAQRLGGALDELRDGIAGFEDAARKANISFDEYRVRLRENTDEAVQGTGAEIDRQVERAASLSAQDRALTEASIWTRPFVVLARGGPGPAGPGALPAAEHKKNTNPQVQLLVISKG